MCTDYPSCWYLRDSRMRASRLIYARLGIAPYRRATSAASYIREWYERLKRRTLSLCRDAQLPRDYHIYAWTCAWAFVCVWTECDMQLLYAWCAHAVWCRNDWFMCMQDPADLVVGLVERSADVPNAEFLRRCIIACPTNLRSSYHKSCLIICVCVLVDIGD